MNESLEVLYGILPVVLLFTLGILLRKRRVFEPATVEGFKRLVVDIALPSLLFIAFSTLELRAGMILAVASIFLVCVLMVLAGRLIARLLGIRSPYFAILLGGFETGMIGYAIFIAIFGIDRVDRLALIDLGQVTFVFFVLIALLLRLRGERYSPADLVRRLVSSPVIIAIFLGLAVGFIDAAVDLSRFRPYGVLVELLRLLGGMTVPLICMVIGYELKISLDMLKLPLLTIAIRKVLLVLFALAVNRLVIRGALDLPELYEYAVWTMFLLPPPFVIPLFMAQDDQENRRYVTATLSLSVPISALAFIVAMVLVR